MNEVNWTQDNGNFAIWYPAVIQMILKEIHIFIPQIMIIFYREIIQWLEWKT